MQSAASVAPPTLRERQARDAVRSRSITLALTRELRRHGLRPAPRAVVAFLRAHALSDASFNRPLIKEWIAECDLLPPEPRRRSTPGRAA